MSDVTSIAPADVRLWVSLDVHKFSIVAATLPLAGGKPEVCRIETTEKAIRRFVDRLGGPEGLAVCYEAGPGGFALWRLLTKRCAQLTLSSDLPPAGYPAYLPLRPVNMARPRPTCSHRGGNVRDGAPQGAGASLSNDECSSPAGIREPPPALAIPSSPSRRTTEGRLAHDQPLRKARRHPGARESSNDRHAFADTHGPRVSVL